MEIVSSERTRRVTTTGLRRIIVEGHVVRDLNVDTGSLAPEQVFAVVLLWRESAPSTSAWIGWLTTMDHRSASFCAADLEDAAFHTWLAGLPGWEPARLTQAIEHRGQHLVWRRPSA